MGDDSQIYEITGIVCDMSAKSSYGDVSPLWLNLDLRRVTGLKELYVPRGVVHLELSDHESLKTICTDYNKFACADDCRHDPAPLDIRYDETRIDG